MRAIISGLVVAIALVGCATSEFAVVPINDPTLRIESYGVSILPPPGPDWYRISDVHLEGTDAVQLGKQSGPKTHTIVATAAGHTGFDPSLMGFAEYATKPEVFANYVKANAERSSPPGGRLRITELSAVPDSRFGYCVKEHVVFEDHDSPSGPPAFDRVLIKEDWVYACLHPDSSRVMVEIGFSERGLPGESDPSLADVREQFFGSLQFRPLE